MQLSIDSSLSTWALVFVPPLITNNFEKKPKKKAPRSILYRVFVDLYYRSNSPLKGHLSDPTPPNQTQK